MSGTELPREFVDRIAQAIGDPGSIVGRKLGPSWREGNEGYAETEETVTRWSTRAVLEVLRRSGCRPEREVIAEAENDAALLIAAILTQTGPVTVPRLSMEGSGPLKLEITQRDDEIVFSMGESDG